MYPVVDAIGGTSSEAHRAGIDRTVQAGAKPIGWVSLALGGIFLLLTALYFGVLLTAANQISGWLAAGRIRRRLDRATGLVLVGFGLRLALEP